MHRVEPFTVGDIRFEQVDVKALSDEEIRRINAFENILRAEARPEDPPIPLELSIANFRSMPSSLTIYSVFGTNVDGDLVADGQAYFWNVEENKHILEFGIHVRPDHRERGLGRALLRVVAEIAEAEVRPLLMTGTSDRIPSGEAFAKVVGAEAGLRNHTNRLVLADVDRALIARWVEQGPERAPGYSLFSIDGPYPDDLIEQIADIHDVMNTAPRDDLDMEDFHLKVEHLREWEVSMAASGDERWSLFARHDESGQLAGFTEVAYNPKLPKTVHQMATGVRPEHRGYALGKWLKAAMLQRVLDERTQAEDLRTGNADSNDPMLGINKELGFRPYIASTVWQVRLEQVRAYLGDSV